MTWKNGTRTGIDTKKLKADHPEIYQEYMKTTTFRTFKVQEDKEET